MLTVTRGELFILDALHQLRERTNNAEKSQQWHFVIHGFVAFFYFDFCASSVWYTPILRIVSAESRGRYGVGEAQS